MQLAAHDKLSVLYEETKQYGKAKEHADVAMQIEYWHRTGIEKHIHAKRAKEQRQLAKQSARASMARSGATEASGEQGIVDSLDVVSVISASEESVSSTVQTTHPDDRDVECGVEVISQLFRTQSIKLASSLSKVRRRHGVAMEKRHQGGAAAEAFEQRQMLKDTSPSEDLEAERNQIQGEFVARADVLASGCVPCLTDGQVSCLAWHLCSLPLSRCQQLETVSGSESEVEQHDNEDDLRIDP